MTLGARIEQRRKQLGISQAELARRVGVRQSTMNSLINGSSRSSRSIVRIAHHLHTTPAYLTGETDDPGQDLPPPRVEPTPFIMMPVAFPPQPALEAMFRGMIRSMPGVTGDELAHELSKLLPKVFQQLRGPFHFVETDEAAELHEAGEGPPDDDRERKRA